jgi:hypothetical protein
LTSGKDLKKIPATMNVSNATIPTEPAPINPAVFRVSLCPKRASTRKLKRGIAGMSAI